MGITSIIIPVYNQLNWTIACIENIRKYTNENTYEIIVVDNASTDNTDEWLNQQSDIQIIKNTVNEGFLSACNKAVNFAKGTELAILHNDVLVASGWLDSMKQNLYSDDKTAMVGPMSNRISCLKNYFQHVNIAVNSVDEFLKIAAEMLAANNNATIKSNFLYSSCLLIKKSVVNKLGLFDENFRAGFMEGIDLSFRLLQAGYNLVVDNAVFIYHNVGTTFAHIQNSQQLLDNAVSLMKEKWGFSPVYSLGIRSELLDLLDFSYDNLEILEVGCACGGTLLEALNRNKTTKVHGIELDRDSAAIARYILGNRVYVKNIEENELPIPKESLDYIIIGDVLEHLYNPWQAIANLKEYLKEGGVFVASIPNIKHAVALQSLFNLDWQYKDSGLLDRTHLRFFTKEEIEKMFINTGFENIELRMNIYSYDNNIIPRLTNIIGTKEEYNTLQWIVKACK